MVHVRTSILRYLRVVGIMSPLVEGSGDDEMLDMDMLWDPIQLICDGDVSMWDLGVGREQAERHNIWGNTLNACVSSL